MWIDKKCTFATKQPDWRQTATAEWGENNANISILLIFRIEHFTVISFGWTVIFPFIWLLRRTMCEYSSNFTGIEFSTAFDFIIEFSDASEHRIFDHKLIFFTIFFFFCFQKVNDSLDFNVLIGVAIQRILHVDRTEEHKKITAII